MLLGSLCAIRWSSERFGTDDRNEVLMRILQEGEIRRGQRAHEKKFHRGSLKEQTGSGAVH